VGGQSLAYARVVLVRGVRKEGRGSWSCRTVQGRLDRLWFGRSLRRICSY